MTDLKPCPFCGGSNLRTGGNDHIVGVWCNDCQASGPNHYGRHEWNTRAEPDPEALVKAALERAARGAELFTGAKHTAFDIEAGTFPKQSYLGDAIAAEVRALADDPEAVAQIIKKAQEDRR